MGFDTQAAPCEGRSASIPHGGPISADTFASAHSRISRTLVLGAIALTTALLTTTSASGQSAGREASSSGPRLDVGESEPESATSTGLSQQARQELAAAGLDRYLGSFEPVASQDLGNGWTRHTFDPEAGDGPICISGTPYSVYTRAGDPTRLLVFAQGGGACWQDVYVCNVHAEDQAPLSREGLREGIWNREAEGNPFADHSVVYLPYCDGSLFSGDHVVSDPSFPDGGIRHHRGVRNQSAALDLAAALFPEAEQIVLAGASAGGVGVASFTPFLVRFLYGDEVALGVFNDAGPAAQNPDQASLLDVRAADWRFERFFPESCSGCDARDPVIPLIHWRLEHDATIHEAYYSTDADLLSRFFLWVASQAGYRDLLLAEHGALHDAYPTRYKRFIVSGDRSHTTLQSPSFYTREIEDVTLPLWTMLFLYSPGLHPDLVETYVPLE